MNDNVEEDSVLRVAGPGEVEVRGVAQREDVAAEVDQADEGDGGEDPGWDVCLGAGGGAGDDPQDVEVDCEDDGEGCEEPERQHDSWGRVLFRDAEVVRMLLFVEVL